MSAVLSCPTPPSAPSQPHFFQNGVSCGEVPPLSRNYARSKPHRSRPLSLESTTSSDPGFLFLRLGCFFPVYCGPVRASSVLPPPRLFSNDFSSALPRKANCAAETSLFLVFDKSVSKSTLLFFSFRFSFPFPESLAFPCHG